MMQEVFKYYAKKFCNDGGDRILNSFKCVALGFNNKLNYINDAKIV